LQVHKRSSATFFVRSYAISSVVCNILEVQTKIVEGQHWFFKKIDLKNHVLHRDMISLQCNVSQLMEQTITYFTLHILDHATKNPYLNPIFFWYPDLATPEVNNSFTNGFGSVSGSMKIIGFPTSFY
jgi:hypothetical protein